MRLMRRSASESGARPANAEDADHLAIHITNLPDQSHNEAIVHWSGQDSSVSSFIIRGFT